MWVDENLGFVLVVAVISISVATVKIVKARLKAKVLIAYYDAITKCGDPTKVQPPDSRK